MDFPRGESVIIYAFYITTQYNGLSIVTLFVLFVFFHFGFESRILVLIVPVHDHCLLGLFFLPGQRFSMCLN